MNRWLLAVASIALLLAMRASIGASPPAPHTPVFRYAQVGGTGNVAIWDPAPGKSILLIHASVQLPNTATITIAGVNTLIFTVNGADIQMKEDFGVASSLPNQFSTSTSILTISFGPQGMQFEPDAVIGARASVPFLTGAFSINLIGYEV